MSYNHSYVDKNLSPSLVVARKTPDFNRIIGDFAILLTFYSVGLFSQHAGFMLRLQFILYPGGGGGGALRCFRYRVCAAGQGIVFTILAPEPGIVFCKNALFKFLLPDRTAEYFLDPLLPDRVWFFAILLQDGGI